MLLGPDLVALAVDFSTRSEGTPVVLLESLGCSISFPAGCARVERLSCLRITKRSHVGAPITVEVPSLVPIDVVGA